MMSAKVAKKESSQHLPHVAAIAVLFLLEFKHRLDLDYVRDMKVEKKKACNNKEKEL